MECEVKHSNKSGECRSRNCKAECSPNYGANAYGDQQGQGVSSLREEKVSNLESSKTCINTFERLDPQNTT